MSDIYRDSIFWVEVDRISPNPFQPRREFDQAKLHELAESIRMYGLLQPLTVTRKEIQHPDGGLSVQYELIAGERRLRASKLAGIQQVPVIIRTGEDDDRVKLELAIIENLQREDLNPVDRAQAFHKLYKDFGFTHAEIGRKMGKSREYVSNTLRLLSLSEEILQYLVEGRISEGHTRPLLMLVSKPEEQKVLVKEILLKKLTVRETESIARRIAQDRVTAKHKIDPEILSVERVLTEKFGTRVTIEPREVGGRLVISFFSAQDLQALLDSMRVTDERAMVPTVFAQNDQMVASTGDMRAPELVLAQELSDAMDAEPDDTLSEEFLPSVGPMEEDEAQVRSLDGLSEEEKQTPDTAPPPRESIFDAFIQSFTTPERTPTEDPFVNGMGVREAMPEVKPTIGVTPTPTRPMPEVLPKTPVAEDEKTDDDTDLYSVRNFSI